MKLKFLGTKNYKNGTLIDLETKTMWHKDEIKEVSIQHAGWLQMNFPDQFEVVKEEQKPVEMKMAEKPKNKMIETEDNK